MRRIYMLVYDNKINLRKLKQRLLFRFRREFRGWMN